MTFTGTALDLGRLEECAFGVTGPDALRPHGGGPRRRDGRRAGVGRRGPASGLPRSARPRLEPPRHPRRRGDGGLRRCRGRAAPCASSSRSSPGPRSTTRCGWVTQRSPDRSLAVMWVPLARHLRELRPDLAGDPDDLRRPGPRHRGARARERAAHAVGRRALARHPRRPGATGADTVTDSADFHRDPCGDPGRREHSRRDACGPGRPRRRRRRRRHDDGRPSRGPCRAHPRGPPGRRARHPHDLPQPAAVRAQGGPLPLPAHVRRRHADRDRCRCRHRLRADARRRLPRRRPRCARVGRPARRRARGQVPPRTLRRHAHGRRQAAPPHRCPPAFFGQKDAQQLLLIRRMVRDLDFPVDVVSVPTVRESDGLAL